MTKFKCDAQVLPYIYYCPACSVKMKGMEIPAVDTVRIRLVCINDNCKQVGLHFVHNLGTVKLIPQIPSNYSS